MRSGLITFVCFLLSLTVYHLTIQPHLGPSSYYLADYNYFMNQWITGSIWFNKNFLSIPWFTPTYCMSFPFYPNPQNLYYSFSQVFFIIFEPMIALRLYLVFLSCVSFWGMWIFVKKVLKCSDQISFLSAVMFMFNGYLSARFLSAHYAYVVFAFVPLYLFLLHYSLNFKKDNLKRYVYLTLSSLVMAQVVYSGGAPLLPHIMLSIFFILIIFLMIDFKKELIFQYSYSFLIFIFLTSSKIYAGLKLLSNFPRNLTVEPMLSDSFLVILKHLFMGLFLFPDYQDKTLTPSHHHEVEYSLTLVPLLILLVAIFFKKISFNNKFFSNKILNFLFFLIIFFPIILLFDFRLFDYLRSLPVLNNMWVHVRFFMIYMIPLIIFVSLLLNKFDFKKNNLILNSLTFLIIFQSAISPKTLGNKLVNYNFGNKQIYEKIYKDDYKINSIYINPGNVKGSIGMSGIKGFDSEETFITPVFERLLLRTTPFHCYEPILGFKGDLKPFTQIVIRLNKAKKQEQDKRLFVDPYTVRNKLYNFNNPICELFPHVNNCKSLGQNFRLEEKDQLDNLLSFKPLDFKQNFFQKFFNYLTLSTLILILSFYLFVLLRKFR